jgi:hypothetical protein
VHRKETGLLSLTRGNSPHFDHMLPRDGTIKSVPKNVNFNDKFSDSS